MVSLQNNRRLSNSHLTQIEEYELSIPKVNEVVLEILIVNLQRSEEVELNSVDNKHLVDNFNA